MSVTSDVKQEFEQLVSAAYRISADVGQEVANLLLEGKEKPLAPDEAGRLLKTVITVLRRSAAQRGDNQTAKKLEGDIQSLIDQVISVRRKFEPTEGDDPASAIEARKKSIQLVPRKGILVSPVSPRPCFHGREVAMNGGFVKTTDIALWDGNERLEIHLGQFEQKNGRRPFPDELLSIMLSTMDLPGIPEEDRKDQFAIAQLARSIAVNGVRKPPIIDSDGTLLDGNRRVAACYYILNSDEFDSEQKQRVEYVYVWQLSQYATEDERNAVVVALNFEPDCKQDWPEYVKARKVYEEWQAMLAAESRTPGPQRQAALKRELSVRFALGPDTAVVNRYLKMVDWATEFELYQISQNNRDTYEVKHRANRYFQYFDELAKGTRPGGVAYALEQDEAFKHLVFDLLFDGKFRNWRQIRELKFIYENEEAREALGRARKEPDAEIAEEHLENAMALARSQRAEMREIGANTRIEAFVKWLEDLPVKSFRDAIRPENLRRLLKALKLVETHAETILSEANS